MRARHSVNEGLGKEVLLQETQFSEEVRAIQ